MRFLKLEVENALRLSAFSVKLSDVNVLELTSEGKNAQGKTSVIRSMMALVLGGRSIPARILKDGEKKGYIEAELGSAEGVKLTIRLDLNPKGEKLTVRPAKGFEPDAKTPQAILNALNARLGFNPLRFIEKGNNAEGRREQLDEIASLVGFDIEEYKKDYELLYDKREDVGRDKRRMAGHIELLPDSISDTPKIETSVVKLTEELTSATLEVSASNERAVRVEEVKKSIDATPGNLETLRLEFKKAEELGVSGRVEVDKWEVDEIKRIETEAKARRAKSLETQTEKTDRIKEDADKIKSAVLQHEEELVELERLRGETLPDVDAIKERLENIEQTNSNVRAAIVRKEAEGDLDKTEKEYDGLTSKIEDLRAKKGRAVADANLPVSGLDFDMDGLYLNGIPLEQASAAEKIEVACAILIESQKKKAEESGNEPLRVILIEDGSLIGDDMLKTLGDLAEKHDYQVILETVRQIGDCAVVIEDGRVKAKPEEK